MMNKTQPIKLKPENPRVNIKHQTILAILLTVLVIIGAIVYTPYVLLMALLALVVAVPVEYSFYKIRKRPYKFNFSVFVTPLTIVLLMPPTLPLYMVVVATLFGVFFGKMIFGGLGRNIFEPSMIAYLFLLVTFPFAVSSNFIDPTTGLVTDLLNLADPTFTGTTEQLFGLLFGQYPNAIGSTFMIAVWVLGAVLLFLKVADWKIPVSILLSTAVFTAIFDQFYPDQFGNAFVALFQGQLMFVAFFVAIDPVTAPRSARARILYGVGIAFITVVIRGLANAPEGVIYAVILMNAIGPMFEPTETIEKKEEVK
jgi:Na+-translocating ferredoxin:NAD+ oxidoreductase RnfD subunit